MSYAIQKVCAKKVCTNSFTGDRWGTIRAHSDGWFLQRDGTVWCPLHVPSWVSQWRHARKCESVSNNKKPDKNEKQPLPKGPTGSWETRGGTPNETPSEQKPDAEDDK